MSIGRPGAFLCVLMRIVQVSHGGTPFELYKALEGAADYLYFVDRVWSTVLPRGCLGFAANL